MNSSYKVPAVIFLTAVVCLSRFDGPVIFQRGKQRDIGEGEVGFHFLNAIGPTGGMNLKEIWYKKWANVER